jgi:hypothetical protein
MAGRAKTYFVSPKLFNYRQQRLLNSMGADVKLAALLYTAGMMGLANIHRIRMWNKR